MAKAKCFEVAVFESVLCFFQCIIKADCCSLQLLYSFRGDTYKSSSFTSLVEKTEPQNALVGIYRTKRGDAGLGADIQQSSPNPGCYELPKAVTYDTTTVMSSSFPP